MGLKSTIIRIGLSYALIALPYCFASAGGNETSEFENRYQPNPREVCEMYASANVMNNYPECKSVKIFEPTIRMNLTSLEKFTVGVKKEEYPDWDFPDVYFERETLNGNQRKLRFYIEGMEIGGYELGDIIHPLISIETVEIGSIDNAIVLQTSSGIHTQMIFTPYSCEGFEGYGDEIQYQLSQVFRWWPNFANEMYEKTFFSPPICN